MGVLPEMPSGNARARTIVPAAVLAEQETTKK